MMKIKITKKLIGFLLGALSIAIVGFAFLADIIGLSNPEFIGIKQIYLFILALGTFALGISLFISREQYKRFFTRFAVSYKDCSLMLLNTIVLILVIELFFLIPEMDGAMRAGASPSPFRNLLAKYITPADSVGGGTYQHVPYVGYRHAPFSNEHTNISEDGIRLTHGIQDTEDAYRVFVFGGSAVYGAFISDSETFPSQLQEELTKTLKKNVHVTNFGTNGWMSTQDMLMLMIEIQKGNIPDLALFMSGNNDCRHVDPIYTDLFKEAIDGIEEDRYPIINFLKSLRISRLFIDFANRKKSSTTDKEPEPTNDTSDQTTYQTKRFLTNVAFVKSISEEIGFKSLFIWIPVHENTLENPSYKKVHTAIHIASQTNKDFHWMGNAFKDYPYNDIWIGDFEHFKPKGHELLAEKVVSILESRNILP